MLEFLLKKDSGNYIVTQESIARRMRHGLFSQPIGLTNRDQYHDSKRSFSGSQLNQFPKMCQ